MSRDETALRYERIEPLPRQEALNRLALGGKAAANAIYSIALHDEDDVFAETACLEGLNSGDAALRVASVGALGEMALFAGRAIDFDQAESRLLELRIRYPELAGRVEDALEDIALAKNRNA